MTPEQLQQLRQQLPLFTSNHPLPAALSDFLRFYGIDFSEAYPDAQYHAGIVHSGEYALMTHRWLQSGARCNLLLVHGYFDHAGLYGRLIEYALSRGCNVLVFDLPGHGLSSGDPAIIDDFSHYSRAIADVLAGVELPPAPLVAMGQSTGCAALTQFARGHRWPFAQVVFLAPLVRPVKWWRVKAAYNLLRHFKDGIERNFNDNSSDREFLEFVLRDPLQATQVPIRWVGALKRWLASLPRHSLGVGPALVIQGEQDGTVAWRYNLEVIGQLFPESRIQFIPEAGHQLANESAPLRQRYYRWIDEYLSLVAPG